MEPGNERQNNLDVDEEFPLNRLEEIRNQNIANNDPHTIHDKI